MPTFILDVEVAGRPKGDILREAFSQIGIPSYEFEVEPEERKEALSTLNMMMAEWPWNTLGFEQPGYGVGQSEDASGLADSALYGVSCGLALRLASSKGRTLAPEQRAALAQSVAVIRGQAAVIPTQVIPQGYPRGAGNGRRRRYTDGHD